MNDEDETNPKSYDQHPIISPTLAQLPTSTSPTSANLPARRNFWLSNSESINNSVHLPHPHLQQTEYNIPSSEFFNQNLHPHHFQAPNHYLIALTNTVQQQQLLLQQRQQQQQQQEQEQEQQKYQQQKPQHQIKNRSTIQDLDYYQKQMTNSAQFHSLPVQYPQLLNDYQLISAHSLLANPYHLQTPYTQNQNMHRSFHEMEPSLLIASTSSAHERQEHSNKKSKSNTSNSSSCDPSRDDDDFEQKTMPCDNEVNLSSNTKLDINDSSLPIQSSLDTLRSTPQSAKAALEKNISQSFQSIQSESAKETKTLREHEQHQQDAWLHDTEELSKEKAKEEEMYYTDEATKNNILKSTKDINPEEMIELKRQRARAMNRLHSRKSRKKRKDAMSKLKADHSNLQMYKVIIDTLADMVSIHDSSDEARIHFANPSFLATFTIHPHPSNNSTSIRIPSSFLELVYESDRDAFVECLRLVRHDLTQAPILTLRVTANGVTSPVEDGSCLYSTVQVSVSTFTNTNLCWSWSDYGDKAFGGSQRSSSFKYKNNS